MRIVLVALCAALSVRRLSETFPQCSFEGDMETQLDSLRCNMLSVFGDFRHPTAEEPSASLVT
jgi:hypothetical protein